jgi:hypothetical protein
MEYGQIAGNKSVNKTIYRCFDFLDVFEQRTFVNKFNKQKNDPDQCMHTFRELILGAYLSLNHFKVKYECEINKKTPDWCILGDKSEIDGIVELTNFHIDRLAENEIKDDWNKIGSSLLFRNKYTNNLDRLYKCIWLKIQKFQGLANSIGKPCIISVFGDFLVTVKFEEIKSCLYDEENGLFEAYPELSGLLYFQEFSGHYHFEYENNPYAIRALDIPIGVFP